MKNVITEIETNGNSNVLVVRIDLKKRFGKSASGKTTIIATTAGNVKLQDADGKVFNLGVNCYE